MLDMIFYLYRWNNVHNIHRCNNYKILILGTIHLACLMGFVCIHHIIIYFIHHIAYENMPSDPGILYNI